MIIYYKDKKGMTFRIDPENIEDGPIAVVLSPQDKKNIRNMAKGATIYCSYNEDMDQKEIEEWLDWIKEKEAENV